MKHKHQWRKVGGKFDRGGKQISVIKECTICGKRKEVFL